jgi:hypothetical protein
MQEEKPLPEGSSQALPASPARVPFSSNQVSLSEESISKELQHLFPVPQGCPRADSCRTDRTAGIGKAQRLLHRRAAEKF